MDSTAAGWLALGALIALVGNLARRNLIGSSYRAARAQHRVGGWLMLIGAVIAACGIGIALPNPFGSRAPSVVAAPTTPPETVPPTTVPSTPERETVDVALTARTGFWEGLSTSAKFFVVFLGIFLFGCFIAWASSDSGTLSEIAGAIVGGILALVGAIGMLLNGAVWLFGKLFS